MKTVKRVLHYLKRNVWWMILSMIFALICAICALVIPIIIGKAIDEIAYVFGDVDKLSTYWTRIAAYLCKVIGLIFVSALCQQIMSIINNKVTYKVVKDVRNDAFEKIQKLPLSYLDKRSSGEIVSNMISDVEQFADGLLLGFSQFFTGIVSIVGTLVLMLTINVKVSFLILVLTPMSFFVAKFISSHTYDMFKLQSETRGEQTALIDEMLSNEKVVKSFCHEKDTQESFDEINEKLKVYSLKAIFFSSMTNPCTRFVNAVVYAVVALSGGLIVISGGGMTVGMLSTMLCYANQYTKPFNEITGVITELQNAIACADRIFALLDEKVEEKSKVLELQNRGLVASCKGYVELDDVAFAYSEDKPLISNLNLKVMPGQSVAIVGPTGCGKTTLINLLMRFYDVCDGSIRVDGTDIRKMSRHELRGKFGMVLQDTWIKNASVLDNILIGKPDASKEEAIAAAKTVKAHDFIKRLPQGYDTILGEEGTDLSAGQKQLLCITRVMLMQPDMLILDEATSNIDTRTELIISRAFDKLMENRTSFVVAHRLSTIKNADVILVMKDGHIIEQGSHEKLIEAGGFYKELYMSQYEDS